jgi:CDP-paratose 2-epimerase
LRYRRHQLDVRNRDAIDALLRTHEMAIEVVVHTGAQPSHDWAARKPFTDLDVNAVRTLIVPDATRSRPLEAAVMSKSTNNVCGHAPNRRALVELDTRWKLQPGHTYYDGIREDISIDHMLHSPWCTSKVAADVRGQQDDRGDPGASVEQHPAATTRLHTPR